MVTTRVPARILKVTSVLPLPPSYPTGLDYLLDPPGYRPGPAWGPPARARAAVPIDGVPLTSCLLKYLHNSNDLGDFLATQGSAGVPSRARPGTPGPGKGRCTN